MNNVFESTRNSKNIVNLMLKQVVAHVDLDCFYAQVEALRLGIDCRTEPFVLSQWHSLIAVNYPARALGISRFETLADARQKCPKLRSSHVATFEIGDPVYRYHSNPNRQTHKVSLDPYRNASRRIFEVLNSFEGVVVEKGGVDEAFLDLTQAAQKEADASKSIATELLLSRLEGITKVFPDRREELLAFLKAAEIKEVDDFSPVCNDEALRLMIGGAAVVFRIRNAVRDNLGYDCSAGIAHNRLLAKLISATHKPNQQTVLFPDRTLGYLFDVKFAKLRGFGGKLGATVLEALGEVTLCGELWRFTAEQLAERFRGGSENGELAQYVYKRVRGYDNQSITPRTMSKSLIAEKVFSPATNDMLQLKKWFVVLSQELIDRIVAFGEDWGVRGHKLNVKLGTGGLADTSDFGHRTCPLPTPTTAEALTSVAMSLAATQFSQKPQALVNIVSMTVSDFRKADPEDGGVLQTNQATLDKFFQKKRQREPSVVNSTDEVCDNDSDVVVLSQPLQEPLVQPLLARKPEASMSADLPTVIVISDDDDD